MNAQQISVKLFADDPRRVDQGELIPVFHRWIREGALDERVLVDVADYRHVHHGPGVMVIAHDAHYGMDEEHGEVGLVYARKRDEPGDPGARLREAFGKVLAACELLEGESSLGGLRFRGDRALVRVMSRLSADNSPESFAELEPHLREVGAALYPDAEVEVRHIGDARAPLSAEIRASASPDVTTLRGRL